MYRNRAHERARRPVFALPLVEARLRFHDLSTPLKLPYKATIYSMTPFEAISTP